MATSHIEDDQDIMVDCELKVSLDLEKFKK